MYLSRLRLNRDSIEAIYKYKRKSGNNLFWEHQMIWDLFDNAPEQKRDFLYRHEDPKSGLPFYYLLSARLPKNNPIAADIQTREYRPTLRANDRLQFSLRANAVVTRKAGDTGKRRIRRDIIEAKVDEYKQRFDNPSDRPSPAVIHQEAAQVWLERRGKQLGFSLESLMVDNHRFYEVKKPSDDNVRRFTSIDLYGRLLVEDPKFLVAALMTGLGRAKAFGCGLLLVRRI